MMYVHLAEKGNLNWLVPFFCDTELGFSVSFMNYRVIVVAECYVGYEPHTMRTFSYSNCVTQEGEHVRNFWLDVVMLTSVLDQLSNLYYEGASSFIIYEVAAAHVHFHVSTL